MSIKIPDEVARWLGPSVIIALGAVVIIGNPITREAICDRTNNCLAMWVGALSGWAAALAAAITISSLFQQAKAAQKQADFQLGDADPTMDAVQHTERQTRAILRIRNWNRRSMIIRRVRLVTRAEVRTIHISFMKDKKPSLYPSPSSDWTFAKGGSKKFEPALMIEGWVRREQEPPLLKMAIAGYLANQAEISDQWKDIPIEIQYELVGIRKVFRLSAHVHLASAAIGIEDDLMDDHDGAVVI